jgi:hypothetical protein
MPDGLVTDLAGLRVALLAALTAGDDASAVARVCDALAESIPCEAASVTMMTSDAKRQTVFAGDGVIAAFEAAQYTLGEGPSLQTFRGSRPVLVPDILERWVAASWPGLAQEIAHLSMAAVFCFPMRIGVINVGVCAFYRKAPGLLSKAEISMVLDACELTTVVLLQLRGNDRNESLIARWLDVDGYSRRKVHQATGMLMGQLSLPAEAAFARLRGHAFSTGNDIEEVADDIVNRRLALDDDPPRSIQSTCAT